MMPLDSGFDDYWIEHQSFYLNLCVWTIKRPWMPKRDALSNKWLWIKPAMRGIRTITGPYSPITETYWVDKDEYFVWKLKGNKELFA